MRETRSKKSPKVSSSSPLERRNWGNIFNLLVQMVRKQQNQLQSLATQHKFLEDRLRLQHEARASDIRLHSHQISQMKGALKYEEKKRMLEAAQADWVLGIKHGEASIIKWILENTEDELADFKAWFEILSHKSSNGEDQGTALDTDKRKKRKTDSETKSTRNNTEEEESSLKIKDELRRLKEECENLALKKDSEVSALLAEKKFVWNQYNIMEKDLTNKLRSKEAEVKKADEKIRALVSGMEQLQSENDKKDSTISQLVSKVANMEAETERLNQELQRLSGELGSFRKSSKDQQLTQPILNRCSDRTKTSDAGTSKRGGKRKVPVKNEISTPDARAPANLSGKGNTSLKKRKQAPVILISETPKLFSSSFKVPKLKPSLK